jgi:pyruvate kinase
MAAGGDNVFNPETRSSISSQGEIDMPHFRAQLAGTHLEHLCLLDMSSRPHALRNTGIICTIGPASQSVDVMVKLIEAGMCIARLNFSHGEHDYHLKTIQNVRQANDLVKDKCTAIALDTKGPEIRTGLLKGGGSAEVKLQTGNNITLSIDEKYQDCGDENIIYVDYKNIVKVLEPGDIIYVDDGLMSLKVSSKNDTSLITVVQNGGMLGSRKGVNLPGKVVDLPALSDKDKKVNHFGNLDM